MTTARPVFLDGAILAAGDLSLLQSTARDRDARHARHLHTPGVCAGLALVSESRTTTSGRDYVEVTLTAGYAVDGTGRELVVAADQQLSPDRFLADNPNPPTEQGTAFSVWHPVFVRGLDATVADEAQPSSCANGSGRGSVEEIVEVEFGRPGDSDLDQPLPPPDSGPGDAAWRVLVGFVRLDTDIDRFHEIGTSADGVTVSGAGARAALVSASTGRLELRAGGAPSSGVPAVLIDADAGGSLTFGTHDGTGGIAPLLHVDSSGNLTAKGALKGVQTAGTVRIRSGTASDGAVLPLPAGVDQATIDSGGLAVSILLTAKLPDPADGPPGSVFVPVRCEVDADRRVSCAGQWADPVNSTLTDEEPGSCDFLLLVAVPDGPPVTGSQMAVLHLSTGHVVAAMSVGRPVPTVAQATGAEHVVVRIPGGRVVRVPAELLTGLATSVDEYVLTRPTHYRVDAMGSLVPTGKPVLWMPVPSKAGQAALSIWDGGAEPEIARQTLDGVGQLPPSGPPGAATHRLIAVEGEPLMYEL